MNVTIYPGRPAGVNFEAASVVKNIAGATVQYCDTEDPFISEGSIAVGASQTLTGTYFFVTPATALLSYTDLGPTTDAAIAALGTRIGDEEAARAAADTALGSLLSAEAVTRANADTALGTRTTSLESNKADISATVLETTDDSEPRALEVYTTNPLSGRKVRFVVENNQDTDEVDIDFRNCTVNFGDPDGAISTDGSAIFSQPSGGTASPIQVNKPGSSSWKVFFVAANGTINLGVGTLSSVAMRVNAEGEANDRYWLGEYGEQRYGPGGATALDTDYKRRQAGIMEVGQIGASGRLQVGFISTEGYIQSRDEALAVFRALNIVGTAINIAPNNTTKLLANTTGLGFNGATPIAKPTGVAVTAAAIHAALVSYGLIAA